MFVNKGRRNSDWFNSIDAANRKLPIIFSCEKNLVHKTSQKYKGGAVYKHCLMFLNFLSVEYQAINVQIDFGDVLQNKNHINDVARYEPHSVEKDDGQYLVATTFFHTSHQVLKFSY